MNGGEQRLSESFGGAFPEPLPSLHDVLSNGPQSRDDLALVCLHQQADSLSSYSGASGKGPLRWTFGQLEQVSLACARALAADGLRPGSRIVTYISNSAEFLVLFRAALILNCIFCPINPKCAVNRAEVDNVLNIVKPDLVVAQDDEIAKHLEGSVHTITTQASRIVLQPQDGHPQGNWQSFQNYMEKASNSSTLDSLTIERKGDDVILVLMTSGTTSLPKGCPHMNNGFSSIVQALASVVGCEKSRKLCAHLPTSHIFGLNTILAFHSKGSPVILPSGFFEPASTLRAIREERATDMGGVPALLGALIDHSEFPKTDTSCLEFIILGATTVTPANVKAAMHDLKATKCVDGWGMSEGAPACITAFKDAPLEVPEKVNSGPVVRGCNMRIVNPETGEIVPRGQPGELLMCGSNVVKEYWTYPPKDTSDSFVVDEQGKWLKTGDQAIMNEEGEIDIVGRYKHLIIRGGENISPKAVEALLLSRFGLETDVVGVPDEIAGEVPVAVIKVKDGQEVPEAKMQEALVKELGQGYALQDTVRLDELELKDFPKTVSGKVQKNVLSEKVAQHLGSQAASSNGTNGMNGASDIKDRLTQIWRKLLKVDDIKADDDIRDYADSLVIGRFPGVLKKETGHVITAQEITSHTTPTAQAKLLESRGKSAAEASVKFPQHDGPPKANDMIHTLGNDDSYRKTRQLCEGLLGPMGLKWEDVQDVLPLYSYQDVFLTRRRPQSNNHRHAYLCTGASVDQCCNAVEAALEQHDMLRTLAVKYDDHTPLHVIVWSSKDWFQHCITVAEPVETAADLKKLYWNDPKYDHAASPGPLFRAVVAHVKDENCAGLVYMAQHSVFDGISLPFFLQDLDALLGGEKASSLMKRVPFKPWIESEYNLRSSVAAKKSTEWQAQRLSGLNTKKDCLFPFQKAPEWFKGDSTGWIEASTGKPGPDRPSLVENGDGVSGLSESCSLPDMQRLKHEHGIDASTVMKAALALLNTKHTGQDTALFAQYQAARSWPYLQEWQVSQLPSAMEVDGPTVQSIVLAIELSKGASTLDLLRKIQDQQSAITQHAQAPFLDIVSKLNESGNGDGDIMYDITRRQIFNWLPSSTSGAFENMRKIQQVSRTDVGILWNCMQVEPEQVQIMPSWDDAQLTPSEVKGMLEEVVRLAGALTREGNWGMQCRAL